MTNDLFNAAQIITGPNQYDAESLFGEDTEPQEHIDLGDETQPEDKPKETTKKNETIPEGPVDAEDLFGDDEAPESVGDKEDEEEEETKPKKTGSSPKGTNLYSSFAQALQGDGLFQSLDENTVKSIVDADSFSEAFENEINARLDEATRKVKEALEAGVEPSVISRYKATISNLNAITSEQLSDESDQGAQLRRTLIRQDLINRGYKPEKVDKQVERIMNSGTDIDEATDALEAVKEYFQQKYDETLNSAREEAAAEKQRVKREMEELKTAILDKDKLFDDIPIDKNTRKKAYEAMTKVVKVSDNGERLTVVQQYADEHPVEFRTVLGLVYAMTDGFTKMGSILTKSVNKKVNSNLRDIERRIINVTPQGGSFRFAEGDEDDSKRQSLRGFRIDI